MSQRNSCNTTNRTAGPDLISHLALMVGLVEVGSSKAIRRYCREYNGETRLLQQLGEAAQNKAKARPGQSMERN
jgi:hypothetical protein